MTEQDGGGTARRMVGYLCAAVLLSGAVSILTIGHTTALFAWPISNPAAVVAFQYVIGFGWAMVLATSALAGVVWALADGGAA